MKIRNQAGFNLVELMVVVSIIGILSAIAVPRFQTFKARAQQTEARSGLNGIYLSMQAYQANYNDFPDLATATDATSASIGFSLQGNKAKYVYKVISSQTNQAWSSTASSIAKLANNSTDVMRTNANNWVCTMFDSVARVAANATPNVKTAAAPLDCPETVGTTGSDNGSAASPTITAADTIL